MEIDVDAEYLQQIGYREVDRLLIGSMAVGISYVSRQPSNRGFRERFAFLPYATLELEINLNCPEYLIPKIQVHAANIIGRRGDPYKLGDSGVSVILGTEEYWKDDLRIPFALV